MAKFSGLIGYVLATETTPGVWQEVPTEVHHTGDVLRNTRRWEKGVGLNDNVVINNQFSIIGTAYAFDNLEAMRYVVYMGVKWKITNIEIQRPRIILTAGGVYNAT